MNYHDEPRPMMGDRPEPEIYGIIKRFTDRNDNMEKLTIEIKEKLNALFFQDRTTMADKEGPSLQLDDSTLIGQLQKQVRRHSVIADALSDILQHFQKIV